MIYLYVKTHNKTGLKYLGKTVKEDYHSYTGSGKRWIRHLNEHGFDYSTDILLATEDKQEFKETAVFFSRLWNIVGSDEWANFRIEEGDGGDTSIFVDHIKRGKSISETKTSDEWKTSVGYKVSKKISNTEKETKNNQEWKDTIGKAVSDEAKRRQNDPEWKSTIGVLVSNKTKQRWSDENFKRNISEKVSLRQNDPEWKAKHYKECPNCSRSISPGNYQKHINSCVQAVKSV